MSEDIFHANSCPLRICSKKPVFSKIVPYKFLIISSYITVLEWYANVTVIVRGKEKTFSSLESSAKIISAQSSAAAEALQFLESHEDLPVSGQ